MKQTFCTYQYAHPSMDGSRMVYECVVYGKECPYTKLSKATKKCQEINPSRKEN